MSSRVATALLLGLAVLPLATHGQEVGTATLPVPESSGLEPAVAEQLEEARRELDRVLADPQADSRDKARAFGDLAELYHAYDLRRAARAAYENAQRWSPDDPRWLYGAGRLAQREGDLERAMDLFRQVLELRPEHFLGHFRLGEALLDANRLDEAAAALQRAYGLAPEDPAVLAALGELALARDEPRSAVEYLETVVERVPAANRLHYSLGLAYRALGDLEAARRHLAQRGDVGVTVKDPLDARLQELTAGERVHILEGRRAFQAERWNEAVEAFSEAVRAAPDSAGARINLAAALVETGRVEEATEELTRALELAPDNATAHFNLGLLERNAGKLEDAVRHLRRAVELQPEDSGARLELARALRATGRLEEALEQFAWVAHRHPETQPEARYREAVLLVELGRYGEARERLEAAHADLPQHGPIAGALARLLAASPEAELRDGPRALDLARRVFEASPTVFHGETVAMALAQTGRCAEAAQWQARLLDQLSEQGVEASEAQRKSLERYRAGAPCTPPA